MGQSFDLLIDGEWVSTEETIPIEDPKTTETFAEVAAAQASDVDRAVAAAHRAQSEWMDIDARERGRTLRRMAELIRDHHDELVGLESMTNGKPPSQASGEVGLAAEYFDYYAGITDKIQGDQIPRGDEYVDYTIREPLGVVGNIVPWNLPIQLLGRGLAVAVATGNGIVAKPAEQTPLAGLLLGELAHEAGVPDGLVNVVPGWGAEAGAALSANEDIDGMAFTGSVGTGQLVLEQTAKNITPAHVELGGKSPVVVYPDAEWENAVDNACTAIFRAFSGQACSAGSRLLVHSDVHDEFVDDLAEMARGMSARGEGRDSDIAPLASEQQYEEVLDYIEVGREESGEPLIGGEPIDREGYYVEPTIFADVDNGSRIAQEEIFGPVLCTIPFDDEAEAIRIANDTEYGLAAAVFTSNIGKAHRFAREVDAGQIYINEYFAEGVATPFGGYKQSGFGREKGFEAIKHYTQVKNVCANIDI